MTVKIIQTIEYQIEMAENGILIGNRLPKDLSSWLQYANSDEREGGCIIRDTIMRDARIVSDKVHASRL